MTTVFQLNTFEERRRKAAIIAAEHECQRCHRLAWSHALEAEMRLVPKRKDPRKKEIVWRACAEKAVTKDGRRRSAA